jgi:hypothetical protein
MRFTSFSDYLRITVVIAFVTGYAFASDDAKPDAKNIKFGGYAFWQFGQIASGTGNNEPDFDIPNPIPRQWTNNVLIGLRIEAQPSERLRLIMSPEFNLNYPYPEMPNRPETKRPDCCNLHMTTRRPGRLGERRRG